MVEWALPCRPVARSVCQQGWSQPSNGRRRDVCCRWWDKDKKGGWSMTPTGYQTRLQRMQAVARARHECINRYFKVFGAFRIQWRHHRRKHGTAFYAAANLVQARNQLEPAAFQVLYKDRLKRQLQLLREQEKARKRKQLLKKKRQIQSRKRKLQHERRRWKHNHSSK